MESVILENLMPVLKVLIKLLYRASLCKAMKIFFVVSTAELSVTGISDVAFAGGVDDVIINCTASVDSSLVDFGDLQFNFTWRNRDGIKIISHDDRVIITSEKHQSTLILSPPSIKDTNFTCSVTISERLDRLLPSDEKYHSVSIIVQSKYIVVVFLYSLQLS